MSDEQSVSVERAIATIALSLAFAVPLAWVLGVFGVDSSFIGRLGAALVLEYVAVYAVAEGVTIGFDRIFAVPELADDDSEAHAELPEAEQRITSR